MSVAVGPSGENEVYLNRLDQFLEGTACPEALEKFDDTFALARMASDLKSSGRGLFFLFGCGSNQHNQLLLDSDSNAADLKNGGEDALEMKEIVACCGDSPSDPAVRIFAGGGHSGILTERGKLYLFGWNDAGQLGTSGYETNDGGEASRTPLPVIRSLSDILVQDADLGFSHTLFFEKDTGRLFAFGDNSRGQVGGSAPAKGDERVSVPTTPEFLRNESVVSVSAGLFHSATVTRGGELITFGCGRFGQSLSSERCDDKRKVCVGRWKPPDGARLVKVACGRRHTAVLDESGRIWTFGDNKYGQLGRAVPSGDSSDPTPRPVEGLENFSFRDIDCGWSHTVVLGKDSPNADGEASAVVFGWGRNDKGQLGTGSPSASSNSDDAVCSNPVRLFESHAVRAVACGSESTAFVDGGDAVWSSGWNEHGNLSAGDGEDRSVPTKATGARITRAPGDAGAPYRTCIAAGGAHLLVMKVKDV